MKNQVLGLTATIAILLTACSSTRYKQSTGEFLDSKVLTSKVKNELRRQKGVKASDIDVDVWKSNVQLNGFVETDDQKHRAESAAWNVSGVRNVYNHLVVIDSMGAAPQGTGSSPVVTTGSGASSTNPETVFNKLAADPSFRYGEQVSVQGTVGTIFSPYAFVFKSPSGLSSRQILVVGDRATIARLTPTDPITVEGEIHGFSQADFEARLGNSSFWEADGFSKWKGKPVIYSGKISNRNTTQNNPPQTTTQPAKN